MRNLVLLRWPIHISVEVPRFLQMFFTKTASPISVHRVRLRNLTDVERGEPNQLAAVFEFNEFEADPSQVPDYVDLIELEESLRNDGTYFIWTCSCGVPGCAGLNDGVIVNHSNERTLWTDLDRNRKFEFDTTDLKNAFTNAIVEGSKLLYERSDLEPTPEQNSMVYKNE